MSDKEWTPADIGGKPIEPDLPFVREGYIFDRVLTDEEQMQVYRFLAAKDLMDPAHCGRLPDSHPFYSSRADDLDHLAPDHPWRKGTVPKPDKTEPPTYRSGETFTITKTVHGGE